ncbi:p53 and DNA damage-regulated protein 1 [Athalia rosae]|uniref:p53 and DNA damage-regulated protein 1 n=1 Tax=Athalia rosae TaxID=37344 RepID=UPI0006258181|nr:p53 and DNA damage-regulated protein 1 [Athalia rosae]XP_012265882.1 p53 and DNA damage-regulated protein 1 [Athalia rosae]
MNDEQKTLKYLEEVEAKAEEILRDRQEVIMLDKRRNDDRMGERALQKQKSDKTWMAVGPLLIKMKTKSAQELLVKDQRECDIEINKIRSELKAKVNELRDLEHIQPVPGLMLNPMSRVEMSAINQVLGKSL